MCEHPMEEITLVCASLAHKELHPLVTPGKTGFLTVFFINKAEE